MITDSREVGGMMRYKKRELDKPTLTLVVITKS